MLFLLLVIIVCALAGFGLAFHIADKKRGSNKLVCPLKGSCDDVIRSRYSKFMGLPVERLGLLYYFLVFVGYSLILIFSLPLWVTSLLFAVSVLAVLFSAYLTVIQVFTLRKLCTWCLFSAALTLVIFVSGFLLHFDVIQLMLVQYKSYIVVLHVLFMALGLGAATLTDYFFFHFLRDYKISTFESDVLDRISQFIWMALGMILLTGAALFFSSSVQYLESTKFIAKMVIVGVLIVNGTLLNLVVSPRLASLSFNKSHMHHHRPGELRRTRRLAFALGPVSLISWYSAFALGSMRSLPFSSLQIIGVYVLLLIVGIIVGQVTERYFVSKASLT